MGKKVLRGFLAGVVVLLVFSSFVSADIIHLKSGGKLEGKIVKQDASSLTLKMSYGEITIKKNEIASITYGEVKSPFIKPSDVKPPVVKTPKLSEEEAIEVYFTKIKPIDDKIMRSGDVSVSLYLDREKVYQDLTDAEVRQWYLNEINKVKKYCEQLRRITPPLKLREFHRHLLLEREATLNMMNLQRDYISSRSGGRSEVEQALKNQIDEMAICIQELEEHNLLHYREFLIKGRRKIKKGERLGPTGD